MSYLDLDLDLTDEQLMLRDTVRKFATEVMRPISARLDSLPPEKVIAPESELWTFLKEAYKMGLHKILIPEEYGGLGLAPVEVNMVSEELGWGACDLTIALGVCCFPAFLASMVPTDFLVDKIIVPFCEDTEVKYSGCWAITEPDHGSDTLACNTAQFQNSVIAGQVRARRDGEHWVLNGQKAAWVSMSGVASHAAVYLTIDPSMGMAGGGICIVPLDLPGVSRGKALDKMGKRALNQGELYFDEVRVPAEYMLIEEDCYEAILDVTLATANAYMSAVYTGVARAAYEEALAYAKERVQGGKPLFEHQMVRYKLFHMFKSIEACRALSRAAMNYNMNNSPPATEYSVAAKIFCTDTAFQVAHEAVQIFGGNGLTREYHIEKIFRDARAGMIEDGSNDSLAVFASERL